MNPLSRIGSNITVKLILAMALAATLPLVVAGFILNYRTSQTLREQTGRETAEVAADAANLVAESLAKDVRLLEAMTIGAGLHDQLRASNASYEGTPQTIHAQLAWADKTWTGSPDNPLAEKVLNRDAAANYATAMLVEYQKRFPHFLELFVTDNYGALVSATNRTSNYYQAGEVWWKIAHRNGQGAEFVSEPEFDESANVFRIDIAVPVRNENGEMLGLLRGTVNSLTGVMNTLSAGKIGKTGRVLIADKEGRIIFDPARPGAKDLKLPGSLILKGAVKGKGYVEDSELRGRSAIVGHAQATDAFGIPALEKLKWTAVASIEEGEALAIVTQERWLEWLIILVSAVLAIAVGVFVARKFTYQVKYITELFGEINKGDFTARAPVMTNDELGRMTTELNSMLDETLTLIQSRDERERIERSVMKLLEEVSDVANGDLTVEAEVTADSTGAIADAFNFMIAELRQVITNVKRTTLEVSSSANEIQATTEYLASGSEAQALQITDTSFAIEEMAQSIRQVSENAVTSASVADEALANARQGASAVQNNINAMGKIRDQVQETSKRIKRLGERSQEIGEIVGVIDDIADRTSLLALNASIQASMAGEAGRGFAVVAEEVERLAERSTSATKRIATLIKAIQSETNEAVTAMENTTREVVEGSGLANDAGRALGEIEQVSQRLATLISSISQASKQQARGSEALAKSMTGISGVTQQVASGTKQAAVSVRSLVSLADSLRESVVTFKLPEGEAVTAHPEFADRLVPTDDGEDGVDARDDSDAERFAMKSHDGKPSDEEPFDATPHDVIVRTAHLDTVSSTN